MSTETKAKYTPGPWKIRYAEEGPSKRRMFIVQTEDRKTVAENRYPHDWQEAKANAAMIAAAPDLLALAHHITAVATDPHFMEHPEWECIVDEARGLIAKAEGRD